MTPAEHREGRQWKIENGVEPQWTIAKWDEERVFVEGPSIVPVRPDLGGIEWVEAAKVEVVPADDKRVLEERLDRVINAGVERWHGLGPIQELHDYLGLTWEEYAAWVEKRPRG